MSDDRLIVLCAPDRPAAERVRRANLWTVRQVMYASGPNLLRGLTNFRAVVVPGFWTRRDAAEIRDVLIDAAGMSPASDVRSLS